MYRYIHKKRQKGLKPEEVPMPILTFSYIPVQAKKIPQYLVKQSLYLLFIYPLFLTPFLPFSYQYLS